MITSNKSFENSYSISLREPILSVQILDKHHIILVTTKSKSVFFSINNNCEITQTIDWGKEYLNNAEKDFALLINNKQDKFLLIKHSNCLVEEATSEAKALLYEHNTIKSIHVGYSPALASNIKYIWNEDTNLTIFNSLGTSAKKLIDQQLQSFNSLLLLKDYPAIKTMKTGDFRQFSAQITRVYNGGNTFLGGVYHLSTQHTNQPKIKYLFAFITDSKELLTYHLPSDAPTSFIFGRTEQEYTVPHNNDIIIQLAFYENLLLVLSRQNLWILDPNHNVPIYKKDYETTSNSYFVGFDVSAKTGDLYLLTEDDALNQRILISSIHRLLDSEKS